MKQTSAVALSLAAVCAPCLAAPAKLGLSFDKRADSLPTLKLPYATYQAANYNADGDVSPLQKVPELPLTCPADIHFQKHPLRRSTSRRPSMGQTSASRDRDRNPRWFIRSHLYPSTHQRTAVDRTWCQQSCWGGCEPVPGRDSRSVVH